VSVQITYIILIAGAALFLVGIALTIAYGSILAGVVLSESIFLNDAPINTSASIKRTLQVTNIERPIAIVLHAESRKREMTYLKRNLKTALITT